MKVLNLKILLLNQITIIFWYLGFHLKKLRIRENTLP